MIRRLLAWWHARQRAIDIEILWPACRDQAPDLMHAREVFYVHAMCDEAWRSLGHEELTGIIKGLQ
jgi:hypothetical protein